MLKYFIYGVCYYDFFPKKGSLNYGMIFLWAFGTENVS
jgi:hypothetical protein